MVIYTMYTDFAFEPNELIDHELLTDELWKSHLKAARLSLIFDVPQLVQGDSSVHLTWAGFWVFLLSSFFSIYVGQPMDQLTSPSSHMPTQSC